MTTSFDAITTAHATMSSDMMGGGLTGEGDVDYSTDPPAASMTMMGGLTGDDQLESRLVDYDVWFDDQGRFEQFAVDFGDIGSSTTTLSDYGTSVSIEAPPADQVTDKSPFPG